MMYETTTVNANLAENADFFHAAIEAWLKEPDVTVACGRWSDGAISELIPESRGQLMPAVYDGPFAGIRELRLENSPHHLHVDFGRIHCISYTVAPSVCLSFRPSFEARLLIVGPGGAPTDRWVVSLMLTKPYNRGALNRERIRRFFELVRKQGAERPDLVEFDVDSSVRSSQVGGELLDMLREMTALPEGQWTHVVDAMVPGRDGVVAAMHSEPACVHLLEQALALRDASLVIFRDRTLIEFKTEKLDGLHRYVEQGYVSWQIGAFHDHHCHLSLSDVDRVLFSAEPVSCQGGGLNYTVWFLTSGPSGNPFRRDGYFSITLNRPYKGNQPRLEVITPVHDLYRTFRHEAWVQADEMFLDTLTNKPPARQSRSETIGAGV